jgi:lipoate-protein ligase B
MAAPCEWLSTDLGLCAYRQAHASQLCLVEARREGRLQNDAVLLLEHQPVFTLGRRTHPENLLVSEAFLHEKGIDLVSVERGGDVTYHGPGQLVVYLVVDLKREGPDIGRFVRSVESVMIGTAGDFGVQAVRDARNRGIWVEGRKLGSIGIAVRRGITFHGFALNVNLDLTPFQWIHPCGLSGVSITSLAAETEVSAPMQSVKERVLDHLKSVFRVDIKAVSEGALFRFGR